MQNPTGQPTPHDDLISPGCSLFFGWIAGDTIGFGLGWLLGWWLSSFIPGAAAAVIGAITGLLLGAVQSLLLRSHLRPSYIWAAVSTLAWGVGFFLGALIASALGLADGPFGVVMGAFTGFIVGTSQWFLLRRVSRRAIWWVPASTFALAAAFMFYSPGLNAWGLVYGLLYGFVTSIVVLYMLYTE